MKNQLKLRKLNNKGMAHWIAPLVVFLLVGAIGGYIYLRQSHAAITPYYSGATEKDQQARINNARSSAGKRLVKHINCLNDLAEKWSQNMGLKNTLYHNQNLAGSATNAWSMAHYCGSGRSSGWAENVGNYPGGSGLSRSISLFNMFMNSAAHRANILNGTYNRSGIGAYVDSNNTLWVTQIFATCNSGCTAAKWSNAVVYPNTIW